MNNVTLCKNIMGASLICAGVVTANVGFKRAFTEKKFGECPSSQFWKETLIDSGLAFAGIITGLTGVLLVGSEVETTNNPK